MDGSITCKCGSCDCVKAGMAHGKQRYKCRICGCRFVGIRSTHFNTIR
ncbi:MAG: IS1/IS1595 family N-terminal zinc-binding domain-containing protein [Flavobacteriales bacterium]